MKVVSTDGLTKLIQLIKSSFISNTETEQTMEIDTAVVSEVTLATVATTGDYDDLTNKPDLTAYALDANVVHKAGDETITGKKTHNAEIEMQSTDGTQSPVLKFHIPNVRYTRLIETSNGLEVQEGGGSSLDRLYAGASDANNTVITTVNKSKSSNGYLQLGNGIIIQWGFYENTGSQANKTLNLNKAFSNTNYKITMTQKYDSSSTYDANAYIKAKTTTTVTFRCPSGGVEWIAIGY